MPAERLPTSVPRALLGARAAALAAEQHGNVSREQLFAIGFGSSAIGRRLATGELAELWPAVYAWGHAHLTRDGWLMAAALACGADAHLCARGAAAARGLLPAWSRIDVATPTKRGVTLDGIRAHRIALAPEERDMHRGLPVTTLARTALDLAAAEGAEAVGKLLDEALLAGQYDHAEMTALMATRRGHRGMAVLRQAVDVLGEDGVVFRSRPERRARDLLAGTALPQPRVNAWFATRAGHGYELDLWFAPLRRNVELDGPRHRLPHQRRKDTLRDAELRRFGVEVLRVDADEPLAAPERFLATVARFLERP